MADLNLNFFQAKKQIQIKDGRNKYTLDDFIAQGNAVYDKADLSAPYTN